MRNAKSIAVFCLAVLAVGGCSNDQQTQNQNISIDEGMPNGVAANADLETLPADESSTTPSSELQNGYDAPDANAAATENAQ